MKFTEWVQSHHRSILFLLAAFALAGAASSLALPVGLFPKVDFPRVVVNMEAGRPARRTGWRIEVTWPVEEAVRAVPGVRTVRSTTSRGSADVSINFDWGQDMVAATLQVRVGHQPDPRHSCRPAPASRSGAWTRPSSPCWATA